MNPLVSIIVPAYNRETLIVDTLESVHAQTYRPLEVLVVDDGSRDGTAAVASSWISGRGTTEVRLVSLGANAGKSAAVNRGIAESRGAYVAVVDSDDLLEPEAVLRQVSFLEKHPECGMVFSPARLLQNDGSIDGVGGGSEWNREIDDFVREAGELHTRVNTIVSSSVLLRRSVLDRTGGLDQALRYTHDWDLWIRVAAESRIGFLPTPLVRYRVDSPGSSSANRIGTFLEVLQILRRFPARDRRMSLRRHLRFYVGLCLREGRFGEALKILVSVLRPAESGRSHE